MVKVLETIVCELLYACLEEHHILCNHKSGFGSIHSTVTALLEVNDSWAFNINSGKINTAVFLDVKKAFDTVDHKTFFYKLHNNSQLVGPYLTTAVSLGGGGTILGPLLFLFFINDLQYCLSNYDPRMCADVLHLTYADDDVGNIESCLSEDLLSVDTWLNANKRTLNMTKSECMLIGSVQRP